jgi:hypothetical protein
MTPSKNRIRAVRYRQLALGELDRAKADMLYKLADEAERNVLCTSDWMRDCKAPAALVITPEGSGSARSAVPQ